MKGEPYRTKISRDDLPPTRFREPKPPSRKGASGADPRFVVESIRYVVLCQPSWELRGVESGFWSWRFAIRWGMGLFQNDHRFPANRFFSFRLYFFFDVLGKTWRHVF